MTVYEIHKKLRDDEVDIINDALPTQVKYSKVLGLWQPVKYGIENMKTAVHVLGNFAFNNPDYVYRIVEVSYTTRTSTSLPSSDETPTEEKSK